jgi:hypothetical protein
VPVNDPNSIWHNLVLAPGLPGSVDIYHDDHFIVNLPNWMIKDYHSDPEIVAFVEYRIRVAITLPFTGRVKAYPREHGMPDDWFDMLVDGVVKNCLTFH